MPKQKEAVSMMHDTCLLAEKGKVIVDLVAAN